MRVYLRVLSCVCVSVHMRACVACVRGVRTCVDACVCVCVVSVYPSALYICCIVT